MGGRNSATTKLPKIENNDSTSRVLIVFEILIMCGGLYSVFYFFIMCVMIVKSVVLCTFFEIVRVDAHISPHAHVVQQITPQACVVYI